MKIYVYSLVTIKPNKEYVPMMIFSYSLNQEPVVGWKPLPPFRRNHASTPMSRFLGNSRYFWGPQCWSLGPGP